MLACVSERGGESGIRTRSRLLAKQLHDRCASSPSRRCRDATGVHLLSGGTRTRTSRPFGRAHFPKCFCQAWSRDARSTSGVGRRAAVPPTSDHSSDTGPRRGRVHVPGSPRYRAAGSLARGTDVRHAAAARKMRESNPRAAHTAAPLSRRAHSASLAIFHVRGRSGSGEFRPRLGPAFASTPECTPGWMTLTATCPPPELNRDAPHGALRPQRSASTCSARRAGGARGCRAPGHEAGAV